MFVLYYQIYSQYSWGLNIVGPFNIFFSTFLRTAKEKPRKLIQFAWCVLMSTDLFL